LQFYDVPQHRILKRSSIAKPQRSKLRLRFVLSQNGPIYSTGKRLNFTNLLRLSIIYVRLKHDFAYLVAVMDWYSRSVLSWGLSNTLDTNFCCEAIDEALLKYGNPGVCNIICVNSYNLKW